jgi:uroporphyrinogen decarboxylase
VAMKDGGYIFHSDHSVPPDVSWENYQYVIEMVHRYGTY